MYGLGSFLFTAFKGRNIRSWFWWLVLVLAVETYPFLFLVGFDAHGVWVVLVLIRNHDEVHFLFTFLDYKLQNWRGAELAPPDWDLSPAEQGGGGYAAVQRGEEGLPAYWGARCCFHPVQDGREPARKYFVLFCCPRSCRRKTSYYRGGNTTHRKLAFSEEGRGRFLPSRSSKWLPSCDAGKPCLVWIRIMYQELLTDAYRIGKILL